MNRLVQFTVLLLAVLASGCGKGSKGTEPATGPGTIEDFQALVRRSYPAGLVIPATVDPTAALLVSVNAGGTRAAAAGFPLAGAYVDGGRVGVFDHRPVDWASVDTLVRQSVPVHGTPYYVYSTLPSLPHLPDLAFDGTRLHRFDVTGAGAIPAFVDSVTSVALPALVAPASGASVPRTGDLSITWSDAGTDTSVYVFCAVRSEVDTLRYAVATVARDVDGAATVLASRLGLLAAGGARLAAARVRLVHHAHGSFKVDLICEATSLQPLTLQ